MKKIFYYTFILITLFLLSTINTLADGECDLYGFSDDWVAHDENYGGRKHNKNSDETEYEFQKRMCQSLEACEWVNDYDCVAKQNNNPTPSEVTTTTKSAGESGVSNKGSKYDNRPREIGNICESEGFLNVLKMFKKIINIGRALVPLILIFVTTMDVYKLVIDPNNVKSVKPLIIKRVIAALLAIFVPTIIDIVLNSMGDSNSISSCYNKVGTIINVRTIVK